MESFQSTAINYNFFTSTLSGGRISFANAGAGTKDSANLDAGQVALARMREALQGEGIALNPRAQPRSAGDVAGQVLNRVRAALEAAPVSTAPVNATPANTNTPVPSAPVQSEVTNPRIADAASAVAEVAQVVDFAAQQRVIGDPKTALADIFESVARAKGFAGGAESAPLSFSTAVDLLRGLIADLAPSDGEAEHVERRHDSDDD